MEEDQENLAGGEEFPLIGERVVIIGMKTEHTGLVGVVSKAERYLLYRMHGFETTIRHTSETYSKIIFTLSKR